MKNIHKGPSWEEVENELFTKEEIEKSNRRIKFHLALIELREKLGLTQRQLSELTDIKQPMLARIEAGTNSPKIKTVNKILRPLGYSLAIVSNKTKEVVHIFK